MQGKAVILSILFCLSVLAADPAEPFYIKESNQGLEGKPSENKSKWTKIFKDMSAEQVKDILGKPENIVEGVTTIWFYQKGGSVEFLNGKLIKYVKPYTWDY